MMFTRTIVLFLLFSLLLAACERMPATSGLTDPRDNKTYKTVYIGESEWMAENLAFYPEDDSAGVWAYNDDSAMIAIYGLLYNWKTACRVCPPGWDLPTDDDWWALAEALGGNFAASGKMREAGFSHWLQPNINANNSSLFSALPAGLRDSTAAYTGLGKVAAFWTSTQYNKSRAWYRSLRHDEDRLFRCNGDHFGSKNFGMSVRCIRSKKIKQS
jgi:uncharacterized protein (TIGR02145 family)